MRRLPVNVPRMTGAGALQTRGEGGQMRRLPPSAGVLKRKSAGRQRKNANGPKRLQLKSDAVQLELRRRGHGL